MSAIRSYVRDLAYRHIGGSVLVLVYHRVAALATDPQLLAVHPARFEAQMRALSERHAVLSLAELADGLRRGRLPRRAVAITFDDGYADNLHEAAPALARHGLPGTVFVSSGYVRRRREFWWDEVERLVLLPGTLPERLELAAGDARFSASLGNYTEYSAEQAAAHASWNVALPAPTARHRLYLELCAFLRPLDPPMRDAVLDSLSAQADASACEARPAYLALAPDELTALVAAPGMAVGGHTVGHAWLAGLPEERQRTEIVEDRQQLAELLGTAPAHFAFPYGGFGDFDETSMRVAREAGYDLACANVPRPVKTWSDRYRLPRHIVRDVEAGQLLRNVDAWFALRKSHE